MQWVVSGIESVGCMYCTSSWIRWDGYLLSGENPNHWDVTRCTDRMTALSLVSPAVEGKIQYGICIAFGPRRFSRCTTGLSADQT